MTMPQNVRVFLHRSQDSGQKPLFQHLNSLYAMGVRGIELDITYSTKEGLCIGHPHRIREDSHHPTVGDVAAWVRKHDMCVLLDLKYPALWDATCSTISDFFSRVCKERYALASYDYEAAAIIGASYDLKTYRITNVWPDGVSDSGFVIAPKRCARALLAKGKTSDTMLSGLENESELRSLIAMGFGAFMTDVAFLTTHITLKHAVE